MQKSFTVAEATLKMEYFCSYQERCHDEVISRLRGMNMIQEAIDVIMVHLIDNDFLNEERFAKSFARGKYRIKSWGKMRIANELKLRNISKYNIDLALQEIAEGYDDAFHALAEKYWNTLKENEPLKKRKRFCGFLLRKGFESSLIYAKMKDLEAATS